MVEVEMTCRSTPDEELIRAIEDDQEYVVQELLNRRDDIYINARDRDGNTGLMVAIKVKATHVFDLLLKKQGKEDFLQVCGNDKTIYGTLPYLMHALVAKIGKHIQTYGVFQCVVTHVFVVLNYHDYLKLSKVCITAKISNISACLLH